MIKDILAFFGFGQPEPDGNPDISESLSSPPKGPSGISSKTSDEEDLSDYTLRDISPSAGYALRATVYHVPTREIVGTVFGDSEKGLQNSARNKARAHATALRLNSKDIRL